MVSGFDALFSVFLFIAMILFLRRPISRSIETERGERHASELDQSSFPTGVTIARQVSLHSFNRGNDDIAC